MSDNSNVDESTVTDLIKQRSDAKRNRDYDTADSIRDTLMADHQVGIDDREKTWRTGVSSSGSGRGNFRQSSNRGSPHRNSGGRQPRQDFGPNGHDYDLTEGAGENSSGLSDQEIHGMIAKRLMAKLSRDFGTADGIQTELVARGVFVHDGIKEWRSDGNPYGDFKERRNNNRGNPGRSEGSRNSYQVNYVKSSYSEDVSGDVSDEAIDELVAERMACKMERDFDRADAIREDLRSEHNVLIDDRLKMWSVGGDFGTEHNARRELSHQFATRGYVKSTSSLELSPEDATYIQEQIDQRSTAKRDRDFETADDIRDFLLQKFDVSIDDKMKLWSVGGAFEENGGRNPSARGVYIRRGGGDLSEEVVAEINDLLMERYKHKKDRDFEQADAIRDDLEERFSVRIDDRSGEWRIETDEYFAASTGNLSAETIEEVTKQLTVRYQCKRDRDYDSADAIREDLRNTYGVVIDDRTKEWTVEFVEEPQNTYGFDDKNETTENVRWESDANSVVAEKEELNEDESNDDESSDDELSEDELTKLTIPLLKEKLRGAGLPVSGKKAELIARLLA